MKSKRQFISQAKLLISFVSKGKAINTFVTKNDLCRLLTDMNFQKKIDKQIKENAKVFTEKDVEE